VSLQIGRLTLPDPDTYQPGTSQIVLGGILSDNDDDLTPDQAIFVADQLAAMASPGAEEVVPVICDVFTGFCRVVDVNVSTFDGVRYANGWGEFEVTLEPVLGSALPVVESIVTGALRQNDHAITSTGARPFHAVPGSRTSYVWGPTAIFIGSDETRTVEGGTVQWRNSRESGDPPLYSGTAVWSCQPEDWYEGACSIETLVDGEYLPNAGTSTLNDTWRASNGLVRFWTTAGSDDISFQWFNAGAWSAAVAFTLEDGNSDPITWRIARSISITPERVSVAIAGDYSASGGEDVMFGTLSFRRGSPWVDMRFTASNGGVPSTELVAAAPVAATDATSHIYQTTAVDGWRWIAATDVSFTADTANGAIENTSDPISHYGVSATHTSWTDTLAVADAYREWFAVAGERTVIGQRL
jgi:hypothetical protein